MNNVKHDENIGLINELIKLKNQQSKEYRTLQDICLKKFDFLVDKRTKRYQGFANYDDLRQDGRVALLLAIKSYDPKKGDFYWWANQYIKTKISRAANRHSTMHVPIKKTKQYQPYKVLQMPVMIDYEKDAHASMENFELRKSIMSAVEKLPKQQAKVIKLYFEFNGSDTGSIKKICQKLNISRVRCVLLINEAKEKLREELSNLNMEQDL